MRILHVTAHLGGGVGKAHAAIAGADPAAIRRHYAVLEAPRDRRFADALAASGATLSIAPDPQELARLAAEADIVQVEWWNHPRIYEALCRTPFPPMRSLVWCHISGLFAPFVPPALMTAAQRFVFTSACSLDMPEVAALPPETRARLAVVNSGFGFPERSGEPAAARHPRRIACLGTLDFVKLSPALFDVVDRLEGEGIDVSLYGAVEADGPVAEAHRRMRRPERIVFEGHAADPAAVLGEAGIFLYLLQPEHYGTAENALVEAMSLGAVPVVFDNPAERAIVRDGITGHVAADATDAGRRLQSMLDRPGDLVPLARAAMAEVAATRTPDVSSARFIALYRDLLGEAPTLPDFAAGLGRTPADWFLSTRLRGHRPGGSTDALIAGFAAGGAEAKGSLAHFRGCFPADLSLQPGGGRP
ncbi:glycosyltransferase [Ensifer soli]|uniref:glycosyltransferase n=1 Tax=Ciceribacter sp. sgz301302 TaxID=3342379 RepID=UPI0035BB6D37